MEMVICQEAPSHGKYIYIWKFNCSTSRPFQKGSVYKVLPIFEVCIFISKTELWKNTAPARRSCLLAHVEPFFHFQNSVGAHIYIYVLYSYIPVIFPSNPIALGRCPKMGGTPIVIWGSCILGNLHQNLGEINHHYIPRKSLYLFVKSAFWGFLKFFGDPKSP